MGDAFCIIDGQICRNEGFYGVEKFLDVKIRPIRVITNIVCLIIAKPGTSLSECFDPGTVDVFINAFSQRQGFDGFLIARHAINGVILDKELQRLAISHAADLSQAVPLSLAGLSIDFDVVWRKFFYCGIVRLRFGRCWPRVSIFEVMAINRKIRGNERVFARRTIVNDEKDGM